MRFEGVVEPCLYPDFESLEHNKDIEIKYLNQQLKDTQTIILLQKEIIDLTKENAKLRERVCLTHGSVESGRGNA